VKVVPDTAATPLLAGDAIATLLTVAPAAVLVTFGAIPVVAVQPPVTQKFAVAETLPVIGVGGK
jgi:hypothetical protein